MENDARARETGQGRLKGRKRRSKGKKILVNILIFIVSICTWAAVAYYGYTYAKNYIDTAIGNVQQQNAVNIQQLKERIEIMTKEINRLKESIEDADSTISSSKSVQRRIDRKLEELDQRLRELQESLEILKEAPNVQD